MGFKSTPELTPCCICEELHYFTAWMRNLLHGAPSDPTVLQYGIISAQTPSQ